MSWLNKSARWRHAGRAVAYAALFAVVYSIPADEAWPGRCLSRLVTEFPCPFCGTTRSFHDMAHGRVLAAVQNSPLASVLFVGFGVAFAWECFRMYKPATPVPFGTKPWNRPAVWLGAILAIGINWAYRISAGLQ